MKKSKIAQRSKLSIVTTCSETHYTMTFWRVSINAFSDGSFVSDRKIVDVSQQPRTNILRSGAFRINASLPLASSKSYQTLLEDLGGSTSTEFKETRAREPRDRGVCTRTGCSTTREIRGIPPGRHSRLPCPAGAHTYRSYREIVEAWKLQSGRCAW